MVDGKGKKLHPYPIPFEGRDERGVFMGLVVKPNVAAEVLVEADLDDDEGALLSCKKRSGRGRECLGPLLYR